MRFFVSDVVYSILRFKCTAIARRRFPVRSFRAVVVLYCITCKISLFFSFFLSVLLERRSFLFDVKKISSGRHFFLSFVVSLLSSAQLSPGGRFLSAHPISRCATIKSSLLSRPKDPKFLGRELHLEQICLAFSC